MTASSTGVRKPGRQQPGWLTPIEICHVVNQSWGSQVCTEVDVSRTWEALQEGLRERGLLTWGCVIGSLAAMGVLAPSFRPTREIGDDATLDRRYANKSELGNSRPGD